MTKETIVKKETKAAPAETPKMSFAFGRKNYTYLVAGIVILIIGFITLSGGGSTDPNVFSTELFSTRRMVFAPLLLIIGYGVIAYAIMIKPQQQDEEVH